jgi:hypothetical protein
MALPEVVPHEQWLEARLRLLAEEKKETRRRDALNAERRRLPMVRIEKEYFFVSPQGPVALAGLFGDSSQLIVHHVMFGPDWDAACPSCTNFIDELSDGLLAQGQPAVAGSRLFVQQSRFDEVVDGVAEIAKSIKLGAGMEAGTQMGPLVSNEQFQRVSGFLESGRADGATALTGGGRYGDRGYFIAPAVNRPAW